MNVRVLSVAERAARFCPRAMPLMVLEERRFVPIVVVATTSPEEFVPRRAFARFVKPKYVVVAFV